jgi:hypothetical protein
MLETLEQRVSEISLSCVLDIRLSLIRVYIAALANVDVAHRSLPSFPTTRMTSKIHQEYKRLSLHVSATTDHHQKAYLILI